MALKSYSSDQWSSEVYQGLHRLDVSDILAMLDGKQTEFLNKIGFSPTGAEKVEDSEIRWVNDSLNPVVFTAAHTYADDAGDNLLVSSPNNVADLKKILRVGSIIEPIGTDLSSHYRYQVDDQTISGLTIKISAASNRGKGSSVASQVWKVIANPFKESGGSSDDISRDRTLSKNYLQRVERVVELSSTANVIKQYGIPKLLKYQIERRTEEIKRELNISALLNFAVYSGGAYVGHVERPQLKGVMQFISDYGDTDTYKNAGGVALSSTLIDNAIEAMYNNNGMDGDHFLLVSPIQQRKLSGLSSEFIRLDRVDETRGQYVQKIRSDLLGIEIPVVLDQHMPADSVAILDNSRLTMKALKDNQLKLMELPGSKTLFNQKWQLGGIYTLEMRNAGEAHSWIYNLKTT